MTQTRNPWAQSYLDALGRASLVLPVNRRAELLEDVSTHLDTQLAPNSDEISSRAVLGRLGEPSELVAQAAIGLPPATSVRPSGTEVLALLLMAIGGVVLPLLAPAMGVLLMRTTDRWTAQQVRFTWGILAGGLVALLVGFLLLFVGSAANPGAISAGLLALGLVVVVGPAAALYAGFSPRP